MLTLKKLNTKIGVGLFLAILVFSFSNPSAFAAPLRFTASGIGTGLAPMTAISGPISINNGTKSVSLSIDQAPTDGSGDIIVSYVILRTNGETIADGNKYCYGSYGPKYGKTGSVTFPRVPTGEYVIWVRSINSEKIDANVQVYY